MDSSREIDTTEYDEYDVLGLAPDATHEEIETAFDWLVRRKGFRHDVPRRLWPLRLRQIEKAYATLCDAERRRAYDETLREGLETRVRRMPVPAGSPLVTPARSRPEFVLAGGASDRTTDSLVNHARRARRATKAAKADPVTSDTTNVHSASAGSVMPEGRASRRRTGKRTRSPLIELDSPPDETRVAREQMPASAFSEPDSTDVNGTQRDRLAPADFVTHDNRRMPVKNWGMAATVTLGLAVVLWTSWPQEKMTSSKGEIQGSRTSTRPAGRAGVSPQAGPSPDMDSETADALSPEEQLAARNDEATALASLRDWAAVGPVEGPVGGAGEGTYVTLQQVANAAAEPGSSPQPSQQAAPEAPGNPPETAAEQASPQPNAQVPTPAPAPAPPVASRDNSPGIIVPPNANRPQPNPGSAAIRPQVRAVQAPKLISGGPTDADNKHGRYRGSVTIRFTVGLDGRGSNCSAVSSSGSAQLDLLTCRILVERGRFTVARDALGRPFSSSVYATYVWNRGSRSKK